MKRAIFAASLAFCAVFAQAQDFPAGASFIFSPKTSKTLAVAELNDPRGVIQGVIPFTRIPVVLTPFVYAGVQLSGGTPAAGGIGAKITRPAGSISYHFGATYGGVSGDNSPHWGIEFGAEWIFTKQVPTASNHEFLIH